MEREFEAVFGFAPGVTAKAPGRVNLLGEHTDYNDGYVLPIAIPQQTRVAIGISREGSNRFHSAQVQDTGYERYIRGCIEMLKERGHRFPPVAVYVTSEVPIGVGLSSSAALEVAVLRGLRELFDLSFDDVELAKLAQEAEIRFAGVRCGIMDQMASSLAQPDRMLFLDTRTLMRTLVPLPAGATIVVIDSGTPRSLAASGYNERRRECEAAAETLGVRALRDVIDVAAVESLKPPLNRRARHVVTENDRVLQALRGVDARQFGELMNLSHRSLRDDFEVSTAELDAIVARLQSHPDVYGARLTGAGFGGACVALVQAAAAGAVAESVTASVPRAKSLLPPPRAA